MVIFMYERGVRNYMLGVVHERIGVYVMGCVAVQSNSAILRYVTYVLMCSVRLKRFSSKHF